MCPLNQLFAQTMIAMIVKSWNFSWPPFRPRLLREKQPTLVLIVCSTLPPPYLPHQKKTTPPPFHCLPVNPGYFGRTSWLSWFSRKKGRGRTGQEATLKQPRELNFQFWNQIFGQVTRQWAWPTGTTQTESTFQQYTVRSLFCWVKFIFLPALFWMPFLGKSLEHDFLLFHIGIITMHWLGRSQKYRNGYFSFQNCSTTKNDSKDSFFSGLTTYHIWNVS